MLCLWLIIILIVKRNCKTEDCFIHCLLKWVHICNFHDECIVSETESFIFLKEKSPVTFYLSVWQNLAYVWQVTCSFPFKVQFPLLCKITSVVKTIRNYCIFFKLSNVICYKNYKHLYLLLYLYQGVLNIFKLYLLLLLIKVFYLA